MDEGKRALSRPTSDPGTGVRETSEAHRSSEELAVLKSIAEALNASADLRQALERALALVADLLGLRTGWVLLLDGETGRPYLAAARELPPGFTGEPRRMSGWCYCTETFVRGDLDGAANVNVVACSRLRGLVEEGASEGTGGLRCHATIPLYAGRGHRKLGVMNVASRHWKELSADELRLLHTIGDMVGVAVERAQWYAKSLEMGALEERFRLSREIHDTLAQGLSATALQLETAEALLQRGAEGGRIADPIREALRLTRMTLAEARRSVLDLRGASLEGRSLREALEGLAEEHRMSDGPAIVVDTRGAIRPLPVRVEAGLYRIAQEALANALTHADAGTIAIRLTATLEEATLAVEDDGRGFDPDEVAGGRFGLVGMRERVRLLEGDLEVENRSGSGTAIRVRIPLA